MFDYRENGLYIGKFSNDYFCYRVDGVYPDMTFLEYEDYLVGWTLAQPLCGIFPPFQKVPILGFENPRLLVVSDENLTRDKLFPSWLNWSFDWAALMHRWTERRLFSTLDYVLMFQDEVLKQWQER